MRRELKRLVLAVWFLYLIVLIFEKEKLSEKKYRLASYRTMTKHTRRRSVQRLNRVCYQINYASSSELYGQ